MENEKKNASSQNVLNVVLVIVCGAIVGLFIYNDINKNAQIAEYKSEERKLMKKVSEVSEVSKERLAKANQLANLYKQASYNNFSENLDKHKFSESVDNDKRDESIKSGIAMDISAKLSPIMAKMDKGQDITNEKLDKIMGELIALLEKEIKKSVAIRKQMSDAITKERRIETRLQRDLVETQKVVADLNGMLGELKGRYIGALEDDSALGDIARCAAAPAKFVGNTLTFDWWASRDKCRAKEEIDRRQKEIMDRYNSIGDSATLRRLRELRRNKCISGGKTRCKYFEKRKLSEPELIKK